MKTRVGIVAGVAGALLAIFLHLRDGPQPKGSECWSLTLECQDVAYPDGGHGFGFRHLTIAADPIPACPADAGLLPDGGLCGLPAARWLAQKLVLRGCEIRDIHRDLSGAKCAAQPAAVKFHPLGNEPWECASGIAKKRPDAGVPWASVRWEKQASLERDDMGTLWRPDGGMCWHPCEVGFGAQHPCIELLDRGPRG